MDTSRPVAVRAEHMRSWGGSVSRPNSGTSTPDVLGPGASDNELAIVLIPSKRRPASERDGVRPDLQQPPQRRRRVKLVGMDTDIGRGASFYAEPSDCETPSTQTASTSSSVMKPRRSSRVASGSQTFPFVVDSRGPTPTTSVSASSSKPVDKPVSNGAQRTDRRSTTNREAKAYTTAAALVAANDARRRAFFHKHRAAFLALVPDHQKAFLNQIEGQLASDDPPNEATLQILDQPKGIRATLHDYQIVGYSWMVDLLHVHGCNGILADEMGLGKTLMTISLLANASATLHKTGASHVRTHLVICPLSVLTTWTSEISRWSDLRALRFHGEKGERERLKGVFRESMLDLDIVVTTYEAYMAEAGWFKSRTWSHVVLDEGHRIKGSATLIATALQGIGADHRLILTGTPVQNNLSELWSLLRWLFPNVFTPPTQKAFQAAFDLARGSYNQDFLKAAMKLLDLVMLRRTKESVHKSITIPPREEITLYVPLSPCQRFWTKRLLLKQDDGALSDIFAANMSGDDAAVDANIRYASEMGDKTGRYKKLMFLLLQLRKVCVHPYLMPDSEPEPFSLSEDMVTASSKLVLLDKLLGSLLPAGHRVLIFSQWTSMLDILEDYLQLRDTKYFRLDGSTARPRRNLNIKLFQQALNPEGKNGFGGVGRADVPPVFLISTTAGGLGITLTAADTVVMYDSSWNPQTDIQAIARAHRIGQTKKVTVYRLVCHESVEQQMLTRLGKKLYLSLKMMGDASSTTVSQSSDADADAGQAATKRSELEMPKMSSGELCAILKGGTGALARPWGDASSSSTDGGFSAFKAATFEECVSRGREAGQRQQAKLKKEVGDEVDAEDDLAAAEAEEAELLKGVEQVKSRLFEGKEWKRATKSDKEIGREWQEKAKRQTKATVVLLDGHVVDKKTAGNAKWEAVKTITGDAGALERLRVPKRSRRKIGHESYCIACSDGGTMYECTYCPRVFHPECAGYSAAQLDRMVSFTCEGHRCCECDRNTAAAGGMLFRCRTCPKAYCEDCLPEEDFVSVGDTIPEFQLLDYHRQAGAHFIICSACQFLCATEPAFKTSWEEEIAKAESAWASQEERQRQT